MDVPLLFIKILSVYFVVSGLFLMIKGKTFAHVLKDFFRHPAIVYLTGVLLIFLGGGVLVDLYAQGGGGSLFFYTTVFAWLVFLKGLAYIFMPQAVARLATRKMSSWFGLLGLVMLVLGVYLYVTF